MALANGNRPPTGATPSTAGSAAGRPGAGWGWPAILALGTLAAFLPVFRHGFVNWDDDHNFTTNPDFGALSWGGICWAWTTFRAGVYQPLAWMFLEAQASLWGLDARGYHAASVLLHSGNAVLLDRLIIALLDRCREGEAPRDRRAVRAAAGLAALLFAVHPLRAEVVAWASCQPYLPSVFCAMMATLAYLRAHPPAGPASRGGVALAWAWYAAAVLFKVEAVTLPAAFLALDVYPLRRFGSGRWPGRDVWLEKVPFAILGLAAMVLAVKARSIAGATETHRPYVIPAHLAEACHDFWFYPAKTAWPAGLSTFYGMPERIEPMAWPFGPAALALALAGLFAFVTRRRWPGLAAALAAYLVLLSPHLGFVPSGPVIAADRYGYLSMIPWAVLLAGALVGPMASSRVVRGSIVVAGLALAAGLAGLSWEQCRQWSSTETLLRAALGRGGGRSPEVRASLASGLLEAGRLDEAASLCEEALRMEPAYFKAHFQLGVVRARQGRFDEAEAEFATAVRLIPDDPDALYNLGVSLSRRGQAAAAIDHFARALKGRPNADAAFSLAILLSEQGRLDEAIADYELSLRLKPDHAPAHNNLGAILAYRGRLSEAERHFREALRLRPDYVQARKGLDFVRQKREQPL